MTRMIKIVLLQTLLFCSPIFVLAVQVPDTGQTKCYANGGEIPCPQHGEVFYGQDAQYAGSARSYTKLGQNGVEMSDTATQEEGWIMTRDNVTGLIWEIKTHDGSIHDLYNLYSWYDSNPTTNGGDPGEPGDGTDTEDFINAVNAQYFGGFADWRMPTVKELSSLVNSDFFYPIPTIDALWFPYTGLYGYWSSTTDAGNMSYAWRVDFGVGVRTVAVHYTAKGNNNYMRAVRAGQSEPLGNLVDNEDGTITDTETGLMWQKATAPGTYTWQDALAYAEGLELPIGGYTDWRLPNRNELQTLLDYSQYSPSINLLLQTTTVSANYWSSTTDSGNTNYAWRVNFDYGYVYSWDKSYDYYVRAVRAGQSKVFATPQVQLDALMVLYNATDGDNWDNSTNWGVGIDARSWYGVSCDVDGNVIGVSLSDNGIAGPIPAEFGNLHNIELLELWGNQLSGSIPPQIGNLTQITVLNLRDNNLSGTIPPEIGNLINLERLYLDRNQLNGNIPIEIGNLHNIKVLSLWDNQISGSIPPEIGNLLNLYDLALDQNQLSGYIPIEIGNLTNIQSLYLYENQLSGSIPSQIGNLTQIMWLNLRDNQLSGSIPPEIGNLTNLEYLALCRNQLTGTIPAEIGRLSSLNTLRINDNLLSGELPVELRNLSSMNVLNIEEFDGLNIRDNCLTATDSELMIFLNEKDPDWQKYQCLVKGDIDANGGDPNIADLILALKIMDGMDMSSTYIRLAADVNADSKIGLPEALYILQKMVEIRE